MPKANGMKELPFATLFFRVLDMEEKLFIALYVPPGPIRYSNWLLVKNLGRLVVDAELVCGDFTMITPNITLNIMITTILKIVDVFI